MDKLGRPRGLVRLDSPRGLRGEKRRVLRPRVYAYTALLVIGAVVAAFAFRSREPFEANVVRLPGMPYTRQDGVIKNAFELHLVNKRSEAATLAIAPSAAGGVGGDLAFSSEIDHVTIEPLGSRRVPIFVTMPEARFVADRPFVVRVSDGKATHEARATFLGARAHDREAGQQ
jgi:polyferredoxin